MVRSMKHFLLTNTAESLLLTNVFDTSLLVDIREKVYVKLEHVQHFDQYRFFDKEEKCQTVTSSTEEQMNRGMTTSFTMMNPTGMETVMEVLTVIQMDINITPTQMVMMAGITMNGKIDIRADDVIGILIADTIEDKQPSN